MMKYFDFYKVKEMAETAEVFLNVVVIYAVIFTSAWVYNRLSR
jgi:hypothetical protein